MRKAGLSIVEFIFAIAIMLTVVVGLVAGLQFYLRFTNLISDRTIAATLLEEGAEALQWLRDESWSENIAPIDTNTSYDLTWDGTSYKLSTTPTAIKDRFRRTIESFPVRRDSHDSIASFGEIDNNSRRFHISIYSSNQTKPLAEAEVLLHNSYEN